MTTFRVERQLPGLTEKHLAALREALGEASRRLSLDGVTVRHILSTYDPERSRCTCTFEAASRESVVRVNEIAQVPFVSIRAMP
jgi:Protein of unknown function (DUF4242)